MSFLGAGQMVGLSFILMVREGSAQGSCAVALPRGTPRAGHRVHKAAVLWLCPGAHPEQGDGQAGVLCGAVGVSAAM